MSKSEREMRESYCVEERFLCKSFVHFPMRHTEIEMRRAGRICMSGESNRERHKKVGHKLCMGRETNKKLRSNDVKGDSLTEHKYDLKIRLESEFLLPYH